MIDTQRARGLTEGIGVGNLLGIVMEGWPKWKVTYQYPDGVREIYAKSGYPDDDDLAQSLIIAEAALSGPLDMHDLGRRFWDWGEENGLGMGGLTSRVLGLYGGDRPQRLARRRLPGTVRTPTGLSIAEASKQAWAGRQAGNGALMRCAPLALRWANQPMRLVRESVISAVPTHWDRRCGWSCAVANLATAAALRGDSLSADQLLGHAEKGVGNALPELKQYGYEANAPRSLVEAVETAWQTRLSDIRFDGSDMGFTLLTLQAVLISYWKADEFASGLSQVIEAGGDTDTNGAAAGAVLGARFGVEGIPSRWRDRVREIREGRTSLARQADALLRANRASEGEGEADE